MAPRVTRSQSRTPTGSAEGVVYAELDGRPLAEPLHGVPLVDDGNVHRVRIVLGKSDLNDSDTHRNPGQRTDAIVQVLPPAAAA